MIGLDVGRVRAVVRKELRDYRRKRSIVVAMVILPTIFLVQPTLSVFLASPSTTSASYFVFLSSSCS
jgi:ABC-2 type transport system permease protein